MRPIHWVFGAFLGVLSDDIVDFDDFPDGELGPTEGHVLPTIHDFISDYVLGPINQLGSGNRVNDPAEADDEALAELIHDLPAHMLVHWINGTLRQDLDTATLDGIDYYTSVVVDQGLQGLGAFAFWDKEYYKS